MSSFDEGNELFFDFLTYESARLIERGSLAKAIWPQLQTTDKRLQLVRCLLGPPHPQLVPRLRRHLRDAFGVTNSTTCDFATDVLFGDATIQDSLYRSVYNLFVDLINSDDNQGERRTPDVARDPTQGSRHASADEERASMWRHSVLCSAVFSAIGLAIQLDGLDATAPDSLGPVPYGASPGGDATSEVLMRITIPASDERPGEV